ncbi:MAG: TetR/AcrR family transcriptional regulator [Proteobacteria bacterium]|nr:TetR/AcrR family transcriptional regulator [Pseudomonadota bacterium]
MNYIAERRQEEKERRRTEILDAAEQVTGSLGWDELTMDQVARRARLSRALLYVYFKDKTDLMYALCERSMQVLQERFEAAVHSKNLGLDKVVAIGEAYIAFSQEQPVYFDILARRGLRAANAENPGAYELACQAIGDRLLMMIVAALEEGVKDGSIRSDLGNRMVAATALWGFTHGVVQVAATKAKVLNGVQQRELLDLTLRMATRSLAARS